MEGMEQNVCYVNRTCVTNDESVNNVPGGWFVMLCKHFLECEFILQISLRNYFHSTQATQSRMMK